VKYESYDIRRTRSSLRFEFHSDGPKGRIAKIVKFEKMKELPDAYNISFGDADDKGEFDDLRVTNNGDTEKILISIGLIVREFFVKHPNSWVFLTGSTEARTRLYRMAISKNLKILNREVELIGIAGEDIAPFKKGVNYNAFMVRKNY
jgi:hypothetical protein